MPFRYRFQKVLNVKTELRKRAETDLGVAMAAEADQQRALDELLRMDEQTREQTTGMSQQMPMTAHQLMTMQHYLDALKQQILVQKRKLQQAEQKTKEARSILQKAMQIENMWGKDKERRTGQYKEEILRQEQKLMDEMAQSIRNRQQGQHESYQ